MVVRDEGDVLQNVERYKEAAFLFEASLVLDEEQGDVDGVHWCMERLASVTKT